jgi:signal transduction histidine kinase/CheY-like chemotaxis protein
LIAIPECNLGNPENNAAERELPDSGMDLVGRLSWGSHFCHFYRDREDLYGVLLPYFQAGLQNREACVWFTAGAAESGEARRALREAAPVFQAALQCGQLEICDIDADPDVPPGDLESNAVLASWMERFRSALRRGHSGLRVTGCTAWARRTGWQAFMEHERKIKAAFGRSRMLCLCSYCLTELPAERVFDLSGSHDFVLAVRNGEAEILQTPAARIAREAALSGEVAQLQRRIDEKSQDLDAALNAREEFLALLGHELRTPLGPLRNAARIIRMVAASDATLTQATDIIERHVAHLSRLVDDLLDLGRLTRGTMSLLKDEVQLDSVIASALQVARPLIEFRNQDLVLSLPAETLVLHADAVRLAQVFSNLLENAAVYTPKGGKIWLSAAYEDGVAAIRIRDNGVGIPAHLLSRIFALFVQGPRRPDRSEGGLGIGLSLVKRLVELHGGTVQAFSEGEGCGSEFLVRLPVISRIPRAEPASPAGRAEAFKPRLRVLVVDDHIDSNEMLAQLLTMNGHDVRRVADGPAAIEAAKTFIPDAVLLDIGMPGMDGYEVARNLRQLPQTRHAVLMAVTGYGSSRDIRQSTQAGIDHHLVKPVEPDRLLALLDSIGPSPAEGSDKVLSITARLRRALLRS